MRKDTCMATRSDPSALRWLIGVELANLRKQAAVQPREVLEGTGIPRPKLSHMENGRYHQNPDDIVKVLAFYGVPQRDIDRLTSLAHTGETKAWWTPWAQIAPNWMKTYLGLEGLAESEFVFEPMLMPPLLQTEDYAGATSERLVSLHIARARRLLDDEPLRLHAVLGEAALRLNVGTPELRQAQYRHLLRMANLPNVTVQVLRPEDGRHPAAAGHFAVLDFAQAQTVAYAEHLDGAVYVQDREQVRTYGTAAENLRSIALTPLKSLALLKSLVDD
jgi:predicted XRE-type DNA-binding protein